MSDRVDVTEIVSRILPSHLRLVRGGGDDFFLTDGQLSVKVGKVEEMGWEKAVVAVKEIAESEKGWTRPPGPKTDRERVFELERVVETLTTQVMRMQRLLWITAGVATGGKGVPVPPPGVKGKVVPLAVPTGFMVTFTEGQEVGGLITSVGRNGHGG